MPLNPINRPMIKPYTVKHPLFLHYRSYKGLFLDMDPTLAIWWPLAWWRAGRDRPTSEGGYGELTHFVTCSYFTQRCVCVCVGAYVPVGANILSAHIRNAAGPVCVHVLVWESVCIDELSGKQWQKHSITHTGNYNTGDFSTVKEWEREMKMADRCCGWSFGL